MHVLVTGVGGFAGARLAEIFVGKGWSVTGVVRNANARLPDLPADRFKIVVSDASALEAIPDELDAVVHAAATMPFYAPDGGLSVAGVEKLNQDNVEGTRRLITLARTHKARRFVFFSSTSVFGRDHVGVLSDDSKPVDPDPYGQTKIACERMLADVADILPSIALRPPAIVGAGSRGNWAASTAQKIVAGDNLKIFNADAPYNNCVHIADMAELIVDRLHAGFSGHQAAIVAAEGSVTIREVVDILVRGLGRKVEISEVPPGRQPFTVSSDRARHIWNWRPMTARQTLERYAQEQRRYIEAAR